MQLQGVASILQGVLFPVPWTGEFSRLPGKQERKMPGPGNRCGKDEPPCLDPHDGLHIVPQPFGQGLGDVPEKVGVCQDRGDVLERNPRLREVRKGPGRPDDPFSQIMIFRMM